MLNDFRLVFYYIIVKITYWAKDIWEKKEEKPFCLPVGFFIITAASTYVNTARMSIFFNIKTSQGLIKINCANESAICEI